MGYVEDIGEDLRVFRCPKLSARTRSQEANIRTLEHAYERAHACEQTCDNKNKHIEMDQTNKHKHESTHIQGHIKTITCENKHIRA